MATSKRDGAVEQSIRSPFSVFTASAQDVRGVRVQTFAAVRQPTAQAESGGAGALEAMEQQLDELIAGVRAKAAELQAAAIKAEEEAEAYIHLAQALLALAAALQQAARALRAAAANFETVAVVLEGVKPIIANAKAAIKAAEERADNALRLIEEVTGEAQELITKK